MTLETEMKTIDTTTSPKTLCQKNEKGAKYGVQCDKKKAVEFALLHFLWFVT